MEIKGTAIIVGAGGIGQAISQKISESYINLDPILCGKGSNKNIDIKLDVTNDNSLIDFSKQLLEIKKPIRLFINTVGILHSENLSPEKRLANISRNNLIESFSVNAFTPILLAKHIEKFISKDNYFNFASISARVGSIADNKTGGWYSYRSAKTAQNQLLKTLSLEWKRKYPKTIVTILHPGTVNTNLSKPFQSFVKPDKLFTTEFAANCILKNIFNQTKSGKFIAWDGSEIPW